MPDNIYSRLGYLLDNRFSLHMKKLPYIIIIVLIGVIAVMSFKTCRQAPAETDEVTYRDTIVDTIPYPVPVPKDSFVIRTIIEKIPISDTTPSVSETPELLVSVDNDTATVNIPITQKIYEDSAYRAYVSGYHPALDSIFIFRPTERIYIRSPTKVKRFNVGLQCGYGMTPKGFQPYIGLGVSATIFSF